MESIWKKTAYMPSFPPLEGDTKTDALIIGGGIAGLMCAYSLQQAGVDCLLVEADRICSGITANTTAKITSQHGLCYHKIAERYGYDEAGLYLEANERALAKYRRLCRSMDCGYEEMPNYVYTVDDPRALERELTVLHRLGYPVEFADRLPLPVETVGAVRFPRQAMFHPLRFLSVLSKNLPVREHTKVRELAKGKAVTDRGTVTAEKIIVATHFPILNKHGGYFIKQYQHRSYVLALDNGAQLKGMYVDDAAKGLSFRNWGDTLLLGGGGHRTGKQGGNWKELRAFAKEHYPNSREIGHWAAQDCMTLDGIPYVGHYSRATPELFVATGFNKWGMTTAMAAGAILTDLVLGRDNKYAAVFSPSRSLWHPQLLLNGWEATRSLLTPTVPRCPHMGCALKYNKAEHTWDCPCHGSRFTRAGALVDNPATDDMK